MKTFLLLILLHAIPAIGVYAGDSLKYSRIKGLNLFFGSQDARHMKLGVSGAHILEYGQNKPQKENIFNANDDRIDLNPAYQVSAALVAAPFYLNRSAFLRKIEWLHGLYFSKTKGTYFSDYYENQASMPPRHFDNTFDFSMTMVYYKTSIQSNFLILKRLAGYYGLSAGAGLPYTQEVHQHIGMHGKLNINNWNFLAGAHLGLKFNMSCFFNIHIEYTYGCQRHYSTGYPFTQNNQGFLVGLRYKFTADVPKSDLEIINNKFW